MWSTISWEQKDDKGGCDKDATEELDSNIMHLQVHAVDVARILAGRKLRRGCRLRIMRGVLWTSSLSGDGGDVGEVLEVQQGQDVPSVPQI